MGSIESRYEEIAFRDVSITERVFEGLVDRPDEVVLIDGPTGRTVTAGALVSGIRSLAGGLVARGFGKGTVVALMAPNIPEFCTVFHGVAFAGGTVTTVNPTYTSSELRYQLNDSDAKILITVAPFLETAREGIVGTGVKEIVVIGDASEGATSLADLMGPPLATQVGVKGVDVVALPYSSGTTGLPKGVMLTHRNLVANVDQCLVAASIDRGEMTPAFLPFFHIYGLEILLNLYLSAGAGLITMPRFELELFLRLVQEHRAKRLWVVPPVALALAGHPMVDQFDLSSVEQVNSAAAPMGAELGKAVAARLGCLVTQAYGMTELSPASHVMPVAAPRDGSVGVSVPSTRCRIVDPESGDDLPAGEDGELWVQGPQVMKGYLNNPEATAECLDSDGWLRTGDIGCFDSDGYLFIHDRLKELIKVKGFAVAPAEVEAALLTHPGVQDAAVIGVADPEAGEVPMAFILPAGEDTPDLPTLQAHLEPLLSHYKQVRRLEIVEAIPKSASGKILRRLLRDSLSDSA